jgi:signal transduction histidine kinase
MKPASLACWTFNRALLRLLACCMLLLPIPAAAITVITQAQSALSATAPPVGGAWQPILLPAHWITPEDEPLRKQWLRLNFQAGQVPQQGLMLYAPRLYNGGYFYLNGARLTGAKPPTEREYIRWQRPFLVEMPPALLRAGSNEVLVETAYRAGVNGFSRFYVGTAEELEARYNSAFFLKHTMARLVAWMCVGAGAFLLLFWWRRRAEVLYGLLGIASFAWALRTVNFIVEVMAIEWRPAIRFLYYSGTGAFVLCVILMMMHITRLRHQWTERGLALYCAAGPLLSLLGGHWVEPMVDLWWQAGLLAISIAALMVLARFAWKKRTVESVGLAIASVLALLMAINDYLINAGWFNFDAPYGAHLSAPLLLIVMGGILLDRFVRTLNTVEGMTHSLMREVAVRETELRTKYEEIQAFERRRVTLEERTRIMQDMHDGLGSQLLSSLVMVERTEVSKQEMVGILRDALDDLRLAIDAFAPDGADLLPALGNLRFRMQSRFKAAGISLHWNVVNVPDALLLPGTSTLPILRITQESLTNIFKHANATEAHVHISTQANPLSLIISIKDNGNGFDLASLPQRGRGLTNLRKRANRSGGTLRIASKSGQGTQIFFTVPLAGQ